MDINACIILISSLVFNYLNTLCFAFNYVEQQL